MSNTLDWIFIVQTSTETTVVSYTCRFSQTLSWFQLSCLCSHSLMMSDMIFVRFKAEFRFFFLWVLPLRFLFYNIFNTSDYADFHFFVVLVKSGLWCMLSREAANTGTNFIVFVLTWPGLESMIYLPHSEKSNILSFTKL